MALNLGTLLVNLGLDTSKFKEEFKKTDDEVKRGSDKMGKSIMSLKSIAIAGFAGWGLKAVAGSFLEAASTSEQYKVRLTGLLGSQKEGNRLFDEMAKFAGRVPFQYREIMDSATALSGVMKGGVNEVSKWMPMIGDLAAASGLSIQETTGQVIRMYSAGAASADMFRERGVLAMLGFQAGVSHSAEETQRKLIDAWESSGSKFRGMTENLATTWSGITSMFADKWFIFRNKFMDAGPFDFVKEKARELLASIDRLFETGKIDLYVERFLAVGAAVGEGIGLVFTAIQTAGAPLSNFMAGLFGGLDFDSIILSFGLIRDAVVNLFDSMTQSAPFKFVKASFNNLFGDTTISAEKAGKSLAKFFNESFFSINKASIKTIDFMGKGWIEIKNGVAIMWNAIESFWGKGIVAINKRFGKFLNSVAKGLSKIPFMSEDAINSIKEYAEELAESSSQTERSIRQNTETVRQARNQERQAHREIIDSMLYDAEKFKIETMRKSEVSTQQRIQNEEVYTQNFIQKSNAREQKISKETQKRIDKTLDALTAIDHAEASSVMSYEEMVADRMEANEKMYAQRDAMAKKFLSDLGSLEADHFERKRELAQAEHDEFIRLGGDKDLAERWLANRQLEITKETEEKRRAEWRKSHDILATIEDEFRSSFKRGVNQMVDAFIAGEDMKRSYAQVTGDMLVNMMGNIAKKMFEKAIDKIIDMIAVLIAEGAAGSGAQGSLKGGVTGALAEIGVYTATGIGAMLAAKSAADRFRAGGGWLSKYPNGGWITEGSGIADDVFLGTTGNIRNWGMGGEFVVNKQSARKHAPLLESINRDRGFAEGGQIPWEPMADVLAIGGGASFLHGFIKGGGFISGIIELIAFFAKAVTAMFSSKYLGDRFRSDGGWLDKGYFFGGGVPGLPGGGGGLPGIPDIPGISDIPGIGDIFGNAKKRLELLTDPEKGKDFLIKLIRLPLKQMAQDLVEPGVYYSSPIDGVQTILKGVQKELASDIPGLGGIIEGIPGFADGGRLNSDGIYYGHEGEVVLNRDEAERAQNNNQPAETRVVLEIDRKVLGEVVYRATRDGVMPIHERAITER